MHAPVGGARAGPTMATAVCVALRAAGMDGVNAGHPELRALLDAGATVDSFLGAAKAMRESGKTVANAFAYVLGAVKGQMRDAQALATGAASRAQLPAETNYQRSMRERVAEVAPSIARQAPGAGQTAAEFFQTIDVPSRVISKIEVQR